MVLLAKIIFFSIAEYFQAGWMDACMQACMYVLLNLFFYIDKNLLYLLNQELVHRTTSMHQI